MPSFNYSETMDSEPRYPHIVAELHSKSMVSASNRSVTYRCMERCSLKKARPKQEFAAPTTTTCERVHH
jgi:hypothetical protein